VKAFFDEATYTVSYVVAEPDGDHCAIIDPVLDYDPKSGRTSTRSADALIAYVEGEGLNADWLIETHAHADHVTAAPYLKEKLGGRTAIGEHIADVQSLFKTVFNLEAEFAIDGSQFDHRFRDGETYEIGAMTGRAIHTPGHTPACMSHIIGDAAFVGDTLFMPDYGTARADFPGGDAGELYRSIQRILALEPNMRLFTCHDYMAPGRDEFAWQSSVAEQREKNIHVHDGVSEEDYVEMRTKRDATLDFPVLILPAIQINIRAGDMPPSEDNGVSYLKIPINAL
jgi:glyoxylase-like metal-dependent hydrolase (beta-lactamase superfamily II)